MKSIIQKEKECYFCFRTYGVELHHCLHGTANRKKADEDGLTVYLCRDCHRALHDKGTGDRQMMQLAQKIWMRTNNKTEKEFIKRYGKNFL